SCTRVRALPVCPPPDPSLLLCSRPRPPSSTLFPYTTLFRSVRLPRRRGDGRRRRQGGTAARRGSGPGGADGPRRREDGPRTVCRSEEHTSELQSLTNLVSRLPLAKKNTHPHTHLRTRHPDTR